MLLTLLLLYVLLCTAVGCLQRRLIYFPTKLTSKLAETMADRNSFSPWKNKSGQIIGWKLAAKNSATGAVLVFHGNAGCAIERDYFAKPIHEAAPVDVYLLEYPGYGAREGSPSEKSFLAAADEAFVLLDQTLPIYVVSESLGTGVAAHLAQTHGDKIAGMVMFVPYNNFAELAQTKMPFLPVSWILLDRYNPEKWMKNYDGAVKFVLAGKDQVIPARFGQKLFDNFNGTKELEIIANAHHNEVSAEPVEWWKALFAFWHNRQMPK